MAIDNADAHGEENAENAARIAYARQSVRPGMSMKNFLNVIWVATLLSLGLCLLAKVVSVCDPHCSFWQDPMEEWIAIGISALLVQAAKTEAEKL